MARAKTQKMYATKRHVNLYPNQYEALRQLAFADRATLSELMRQAVDEYLERRHSGRKRRV